jgi:peptidoglycan hydrolase-like protein with peptidoglycan-binding domain
MMTPRQARVALGTFILVAAGVAYNALYMQGEGSPGRRMANDATGPGSAQVHAPRAGQARADQTTKRTAVLKPASASAREAPESAPAEAGADTVRAIQRELNQRGFGPLAIDGAVRPVTRAAILAYEHDHRLALTGEASEALLKHLLLGHPADGPRAGAGEVQSPHAETIIKQVQRLLVATGYRPGPANGRLSAETVTAIRAFEHEHGLAPKGRVSAEVLARLQTSAARLKAAEAR